MIILFLFYFTLFLLIYAYLLYPAIAILVGAAKRKPGNAEQPSISVLVPAHNEAEVIRAKIDNFLELDYPKEIIEMVIADDGSTDDTASVVEAISDHRIRLIKNSVRLGKAGSMNVLVEQAKNSFLLFSDANVMFTKDAVQQLVEPMKCEKVGAVTGEVKLFGSDSEFGSGESLYYWIERRIQMAESRFNSVMGVDGGMYLLRRELYKLLPNDTILDDFTVSINVMRSGFRIIYQSSAKATEGGTPSTKQEFARRKRIAAGAVQLLKRGNTPRLTQPVFWIQFFSHKLLRWFSPCVLFIFFLSNSLLVFDQMFYVVPFLVQLAIFLTIFVTWMIPSLRRSRIGSTLFYFGISQVAMAIGLCNGLLNRQSSRWERGSRMLGEKKGN